MVRWKNMTDSFATEETKIGERRVASTTVGWTTSVSVPWEDDDSMTATTLLDGGVARGGAALARSGAN